MFVGLLCCWVVAGPVGGGVWVLVLVAVERHVVLFSPQSVILVVLTFGR